MLEIRPRVTEGTHSFAVGGNKYEIEVEEGKKIKITKTVGFGTMDEYDQTNPLNKYSMLFTRPEAKRIIAALTLLLDD